MAFRSDFNNSVSRESSPDSQCLMGQCSSWHVDPAEAHHVVTSVGMMNGAICSLRSSPHILHCDRADDNTALHYFALTVLEGEVTLEQRSTRLPLGKGSCVLFDGADPTTVRASECHLVCLFIFPNLRLLPTFSARLLRNGEHDILINCTKFLATSFGSISRDVIQGVFGACAILAAQTITQHHLTAYGSDKNGGAFRLTALREFITENICDPELSARTAAKHFGVSTRYIHKFFRSTGTSFGRFVQRERLRGIRNELAGDPFGKLRVAEIARKWGFRDLSTFHRSFKAEFGCVPRKIACTDKAGAEVTQAATGYAYLERLDDQVEH